MPIITIPKEKIQKDDLVIIPRKEYEELLNLKKAIPKNQAWFWTEEWQKKEKEADKALRKGKYKKFKDVKNLLKDLHS